MKLLSRTIIFVIFTSCLKPIEAQTIISIDTSNLSSTCQSLVAKFQELETAVREIPDSILFAIYQLHNDTFVDLGTEYINSKKALIKQYVIDKFTPFDVDKIQLYQLNYFLDISHRTPFKLDRELAKVEYNSFKVSVLYNSPIKRVMGMEATPTAKYIGIKCSQGVKALSFPVFYRSRYLCDLYFEL
jgi:hypothetical protein